MHRILILFAHPVLEKSLIHRRFIRVARRTDGIELNDLYEKYPDFMIDVDYEQTLLKNSDIIVFQHPLYWYSAPALLKEWQDQVLEYGFCYGPDGKALHGKYLLNVVSTVSRRDAYARTGHNHYSIQELLRPVEQTARLCGMTYLPPFVVHSTRHMDKSTMKAHTRDYFTLLTTLQETLPKTDELVKGEYLNHWLQTQEMS